MSRRRVRVLVVDDSPLSVDVLASRIARDPRFEVVGIAYDGLRAVELAKKLRPSVITMDLNMPKLDGLAAIERVMKESPTRILVVTGQDDRGTLAFEALRRGACDILEKPRPHEDRDGADVLCERIWAIARAPFGARPSRPSRIPRRIARETSVTTIGLVASTGGPASLATILGSLPADFPAAIAIVQHLPSGFAARLARWLDGVSPLTVALAVNGERVEPGRVLIASDDRHLTIDSRGRARLSHEAPVDGHRPSGTRLLTSLAELGPRAAGVVLTGMGRDGAAGLSALRRAGGRTAAQDEATSVVYGMPRAALDAQAAEVSLPLEGVAPYLLQLVGRGER